jgi:nitroreductase
MDQMMEVIKKRISIRAYKDEALSPEIINAILEAAKHAPTARNMQELEYKVITNKELIKQASDSIAAVVKRDSPAMPVRATFFYNAPLLILITGPGDNQWIFPDAGLAAQNIMLYAASINLGSCFIGMSRMIEKDPEMLKKLHIASDKKIAAAIVCGYPNEKPAAKEKKMNAEFFK